jgi:hypothetical protein
MLSAEAHPAFDSVLLLTSWCVRQERSNRTFNRVAIGLQALLLVVFREAEDWIDAGFSHLTDALERVVAKPCCYVISNAVIQQLGVTCQAFAGFSPLARGLCSLLSVFKLLFLLMIPDREKKKKSTASSIDNALMRTSVQTLPFLGLCNDWA